MKKFILSSLFLNSVVAFTQAQDSVYYYYDGEKIYLTKEDNTKVIQFANEHLTPLRKRGKPTTKSFPLLGGLRGALIRVCSPLSEGLGEVKIKNS